MKPTAFIQDSNIRNPEVPANNTSEFSDRANYKFYHLEGDMTYDDA